MERSRAGCHLPIHTSHLVHVNAGMQSYQSPQTSQTADVRTVWHSRSGWSSMLDSLTTDSKSQTLVTLSYVDDLLIIGEESEVSAFITNISKLFILKHSTHRRSGTWTYFLGRKIHR
eukprot:473221-Amphidinium_carterae.1